MLRRPLPRRLLWSLAVLPCLALAAVFLPRPSAGDEAAPAKFAPLAKDRIAVLGNTLADRMQHDGWLETMFVSRFPKHDLAFRNLGFSGDELTLRIRSSAFGSPEEWLTRTRADVVFAFFGYNESFAGKEGLPKFEKDLDAFARGITNATFSGKAKCRLVLFSPIAFENTGDPNLPDGSEHNPRLEMYTAAMAKVAKANGVPFVDLFAATKKLYADNTNPKPTRYTINGVHLNPEGNRAVAKIIDDALFPGAKPEGDRSEKALAALRAAVLDKNFHWYQRYRTTDGYSVFGGRADLRFVGGQTNRVVAQREMEVLDVMTANRDAHLWKIARGESPGKVDDSNTPDFIPVVTNKPGPLQGGKHVFLDPEKAIERMKVGANMKVNLFASEKQFKEFVNPVQMSFDAKGRLWVAVWPTYPHWKPKEPMNDKILILEDTDGDGKADTCKVFADGLHCPTGFEFYNGGVLVAQAPDVWFLKDSKGGDKADIRERVVHGIDSADTHHASNSFTLDPGGALYMQEGTFHHTQVESAWGPTMRLANAGVFRYEPRAQKFETYVTFGFANPHGHVFDRWGRDIVIDGTGSQPYDAALFSGRLDYPQKHGRPPQVWQQRTRPCPGMEVLSSKHFPDEMQGDVLVGNVIGFQGLLRYKIKEDGGSLAGVEQEPIVSSTDPNFRPSDFKVGPDGAIYMIDWHNPIIGHMQHNLRDPSRDKEHGRVYRITYNGRKLSEPAKIAGEPVEKLLDLLKSPEDRVRYRTRIELGSRPTKEVIAAAQKWLAGLDEKDADYEHHVLEGLWLHQSHNVVDKALLTKVLASKDGRARSAATRVLCYWRDRVPGALDLLRKLAGDDNARVRLEAVRAASFFNEPEAVEVALVAKEKPTDKYIDFVEAETMKQLQPIVRKAIADGRKIGFKTAAGARFFLKSVATEDLLKLDRSQGVYLELMFRAGVRDEYRAEALSGLAKMEKRPELAVLLEAISRHDAKDAPDEESVAFDLVRLLTARPAKALAESRPELEKLALSARQPLTRQLGYVALIAADGDPAKAWDLGAKSVGGLIDVVNAVGMIRDPSQRDALYPKVEALLKGLPPGIDAKGGKGVTGRFVRVELPGRQRTLTLAEVEVFSDGVNVARTGKASQSSTAHGGPASRAIDGNKNGTFAEGGQTHTAEGQRDPWWEVDLGKSYPIERIEVYNRTDGALGTRLKDYTVRVLDASKKEVYRKEKNPTPAVKAAFVLGEMSPEKVIRRTAMRVMPVMRGRENDAVKAIVPFLKEPLDRPTAVSALSRIPAAQWPKDSAEGVVEALLVELRKLPAAERTTQTALDELQLAGNVAGLLEPDRARKVRRELNDLGVRVLGLGTVVEQMRYDRERLVVQAGKRVEIAFDNIDTMPHNFVLIEPGSLEEIGKTAEATATDPKAMARQYVPASRKVIYASNLLQPRQAQRLGFTAPTKPGVYPYVCTYPGHWMRMHGALYVVADLEAYEADPEGYLAKNPMTPADELLKFNRPRKEWKLAELADGVKELKGRSFATGKQMFTVGTCVSCHKFDGKGQEFGPDLTKLDAKWKPLDLLTHVIDPSLKIDDKYRVWTFELNSGKSVTGMILEETKEVVKVVENPLASTTAKAIKVATIASRTKSPSSQMPKGLLDKMTRDEILDLIAYVWSKADPKDKAFAEGHHGGK